MPTDGICGPPERKSYRRSSERRSTQLTMRYLPKSSAERERMLREIGVGSIDELFSHIPSEYRLNRELAIPRQMAESEIVDWFRARAAENASGYPIMLGAGAYHHYRPLVIDSLVS